MENSVFAVIDTKAVMAHVYSGAITPVFNDEIIKEKSFPTLKMLCSMKSR